MFTTQRQALITDFGLFGDTAAWSFVVHNVHRPWFYVAAVEGDEKDFSIRPMLMLSDEQSLKTLMDECDQDLHIESVLLVTPHHMNQSGRWLMEPLSMVERHDTPDGVVIIYQVAGGKVYSYGNSKAKPNSESRRTVIFDGSKLTQ